MSIELASEMELATLLPLVRAFHAHEKLAMNDEDRTSVVRRLLTDPTWGRIWLIYDGVEAAGYIAICTGFSIEFRGNDGRQAAEVTGGSPRQPRHPARRGRRVGGAHADGLIRERCKQKLDVRPQTCEGLARSVGADVIS
jgi:hypothetical protein